MFELLRSVKICTGVSLVSSRITLYLPSTRLAFAREVAETIELESLREHVLKLVREKLGKDDVEELA